MVGIQCGRAGSARAAAGMPRRPRHGTVPIERDTGRDKRLGCVPGDIGARRYVGATVDLRGSVVLNGPARFQIEDLRAPVSWRAYWLADVSRAVPIAKAASRLTSTWPACCWCVWLMRAGSMSLTWSWR